MGTRQRRHRVTTGDYNAQSEVTSSNYNTPSDAKLLHYGQIIMTKYDITETDYNSQ